MLIKVFEEIFNPNNITTIERIGYSSLVSFTDGKDIEIGGSLPEELMEEINKKWAITKGLEKCSKG